MNLSRFTNPANEPRDPERAAEIADMKADMRADVKKGDRASDLVSFVRFAQLSEACLEGHEYALSENLPRISERWASPELRDSWITGYLTELRNRLEAQKP